MTAIAAKAWTYSGRLLLVLIAAAALALGALLLATFLGYGTESSCACSYNGYREAAALVQDSETIVVATYVGQRTVRTSTTNPVSGESGEHRVVLRSYRIVESIKSSQMTGEVIELFDGPSARDEHYVFFLIPLSFGSVQAWTWPGVPEYARIDGDQLLFHAGMKDYRNEVERLGRPVAGCWAPFALDLPGLRALTAQRARD